MYTENTHFPFPYLHLRDLQVRDTLRGACSPALMSSLRSMVLSPQNLDAGLRACTHVAHPPPSYPQTRCARS